MPSFDVNAMRQRAASVFAGFTNGQKAMLGLAGAGVVVGSLLMTQLSGGTPYSTLYANLPASDAAAVTQDLQSRGVSYQLADGGGTIKVHQSDVYQLRIDLSAKGLPAEGSPGYSLLDKQGITTSEFRQRVDYQRAIEGELAKTVKAIDGVDAASVHVVVPTQDLFTQDAPKPTASVLVQTRPGTRLSSEQVRAVVHLVAASVEGLTPDNVTVADSNGRVLAAPGQDGADGTDARTEQTKALEDSLATSIEQMVARVTGDGHAEVRVKADMDFDRSSTVTEKYDDPTKAVTLAEKTSKETYVGAGSANSAGVLGTTSAATGTNTNLPICPTTTTPAVAGAAPTTTVPCTPASKIAPGTTGQTGSGGNNYLKEDAQRDFGLGKTTQRVDAATGTIKRLSVAVLLDRNTKVNTQQLQSLVSAAAGLDTTRGDTISIAQLPFDTTAAKQAAAELKKTQGTQGTKQLFRMIEGVGLLLLVLIALFLAYRSARKSVTRYPIAIPVGAASNHVLARTEGAMGQLPQGDHVDSSIGSSPLEITARPHEIDIAHLLERQPEDVAMTLRGWLADRRN